MPKCLFIFLFTIKKYIKYSLLWKKRMFLYINWKNRRTFRQKALKWYHIFQFGYNSYKIVTRGVIFSCNGLEGPEMAVLAKECQAMARKLELQRKEVS